MNASRRQCSRPLTRPSLAEALERRTLLTIDNPSIAEGAPGATADLVFNVAFRAPVRQSLLVSYVTVDGTATATGGDYTPTEGWLDYGPVLQTKQVHVPVRGDATREPDETVILELYDGDTGDFLGRGTGTIINDDAGSPPVVQQLRATPAAVRNGESFVLSAVVVDPDGDSIRRVTFFRESDGLAGWTGGDVQIGADTSAPFEAAVAVNGLVPGDYWYYARAEDDTGMVGAPSAATATVVNSLATFDQFTDAPDPVHIDQTLTLTAAVSDPDGPVGQVAFFRESDGVAGLSQSDSFLGVDDSAPFTWSGSVSGLTLGTYTYYARAADNGGALVVASLTNTLTSAPPVINQFRATPQPVFTGGTLTLAATVSDADGAVDIAGVTFYRDSNGLSGLQTGPGGDAVLGFDAVAADGYGMTFSIASLPPGDYRYFAVATDRAGAKSFDALAFSTVIDPPPAVQSLTASPAVVALGQAVALTAGGVGASAASVSFYRESNSTPGLQADSFAGDTLVSIDSTGADGYTAALDTTPLSPDQYMLYAVARDASGRSGPPASAKVDVTGTPDRYELNNTFDTATDFGAVARFSQLGLSLHVPGDVDVFRFTATATGRMAVRPTVLTGDLIVAVYDGSRELITTGAPTPGTRPFALDVVQGQSYYVRVSSPSGAVIGSYALSAGYPSTLSALTATPGASPPGALLTLAASGLVNPDGDFVGVQFVREANGVPGIQLDIDRDPAGGDVFVGSATAPDPDGIFRLRTSLRGLAPGQYTYYAIPFDSSSGALTAGAVSTTHALLPPQPVAVTGRQMFYRGSKFQTAVAGGEDNAIAPDKVALLPGQGAATFANVTSSARGLNGLIVDFAWLPGVTPVLVAEDFEFAVSDRGPGAAPAPVWLAAPAPLSVTLRPNGSPSGDDRSVISFADGAIRNQWLRVTVKPTAHTGLASPDVFYFGSLVGETGDPVVGAAPAAWRVDAKDEVAVRGAIARPFNATLTSRYDLNRDGVVNVRDEVLARANSGNVLSGLTAPAPAVVAQSARRRTRGAYELLDR